MESKMHVIKMFSLFKQFLKHNDFSKINCRRNSIVRKNYKLHVKFFTKYEIFLLNMKF